MKIFILVAADLLVVAFCLLFFQGCAEPTKFSNAGQSLLKPLCSGPCVDGATVSDQDPSTGECRCREKRNSR